MSAPLKNYCHFWRSLTNNTNLNSKLREKHFFMLHYLLANCTTEKIEKPRTKKNYMSFLSKIWKKENQKSNYRKYFYLWNTGLESTLASPYPPPSPPKSPPQNEQNKNSSERVGRMPLKHFRKKISWPILLIHFFVWCSTLDVQHRNQTKLDLFCFQRFGNSQVWWRWRYS